MTAPGWYPVPGTAGQRFWDGSQWTGVATMPLAAMPMLPQQRERRTSVNYGFMTLACISLFFSVVPAIFWFVVAGNMANDPDPSTAASASGAVLWGVMWLLWGLGWTGLWFAFGVSRRR